MFDPFNMSASSALGLMVAWRTELATSSTSQSRTPAS
jgi:hypothetical protein